MKNVENVYSSIGNIVTHTFAGNVATILTDPVSARGLHSRADDVSAL